MHQILALLRLIHRELYLLGPGIVPVVLSKYRITCGIGLCCLCALAAGLELIGRRWLSAVLWIVSAALVLTGLAGDSLLWPSRTSALLGAFAIAAGALAVVLALWHELQFALSRARHERMRLRRIPGSEHHHPHGRHRSSVSRSESLDR